MRTASPPALQRASTPEVDFRRIAADLEHIRAVGGLAPQRLESLRLAASMARAVADGSLSRALSDLGCVRLAREAGHD